MVVFGPETAASILRVVGVCRDGCEDGRLPETMSDACGVSGKDSREYSEYDYEDGRRNGHRSASSCWNVGGGVELICGDDCGMRLGWSCHRSPDL